MLLKWQQAVQSKSLNSIKFILNEGYIPENLHQLICINDYSHEESLSIIDILLKGNNLAQDAKNFDTADKLLTLGAKLPDPLVKIEDFESKSEFLAAISRNDVELYKALRNNPSIINLQDEDGKTIVHHAATIGRLMGSNSAYLIHILLFESPFVNLNIQDVDGNTPLHITAYHCNDRVTCRYIFPNYVRAAVKRGSDLNLLNNQGQAIIHIAVRTAYEYWATGRDNTVERLLIAAGNNIDLNTLSSSGSTAFYYALNWLHLKEARSLLEAGAKPMIYGAPDRNPLKMIDEQIENLKQSLNLIKAFESDSIIDFMKNNESFLVKLFKGECEVCDDNLNFEEKVHEFAAHLSRNKESFQFNLTDLESLKQTMLAITFTIEQEKADKFSFWSKTTNSHEWDNIITQIDDDRCGPGYGF